MAAIAQELEDKNEALQPLVQRLNDVDSMKNKELVKALKKKKLPFKDIEKEDAELAQRLKDSLQVEIDQTEAEHAAGAMASAARRAKLRAGPSRKRRAVIGGARLTYKATKLTTTVALKTTKIAAKTTYSVATDKRTHTAVKTTGRTAAKGTVMVVKGTSSAAKSAAPVLTDGVKKGIASAPAVMAGAASGAKLAGKGVVKSAGMAKKGVNAINQLRAEDIEEEEELSEEAQKKALEEVRKMARRQAVVDSELRKLRVLRNDGVISDDDFVRQEAYILASSIPTVEPDDTDDEEESAREVAVVASVVKLFAPIKYGKGEFHARRSELESWILMSFGSKGRSKKRAEKAHLWANCLLSAGISSLGHLQSLIEKGEITVKILVSIGLRPKQQCASLIEQMKESSLNVRLYAALAIQRAFRYRAWNRQHSAGIQKRLREVIAQKMLSKGLAAMTESKWLIARDIFESGLDKQTGSPDHIGLQQAKAKAELELELEADDVSSKKDKRLRRKEHDASAEDELRAYTAKMETEKLSRLEAAQTAADDLMMKIDSGEWDEQERKRKEELAASIVAAEEERERLKALAIERAELEAIEAKKQAKLEAKQKKQEEKQVIPTHIGVYLLPVARPSMNRHPEETVSCAGQKRCKGTS
eukprot:COSAG02_NODE_3318_length_6948_cov_2.602424_2_plen_646_part_00